MVLSPMDRNRPVSASVFRGMEDPDQGSGADEGVRPTGIADSHIRSER
jgi:hypothetical protein